jgi:DNA replication protein DnaC
MFEKRNLISDRFLFQYFKLCKNRRSEFTERILHYQRLKLSGMARILSVRLHEAEVADLPYHQFLENLVNDELNRQATSIHNRRLKEARFPMLKTIDQFDFGFNSTIKKRDILDLLTCRCIIEKRNVLFIGPPGVGKTHLAIAFGISAIEKGYRVSFRSI